MHTRAGTLGKDVPSALHAFALTSHDLSPPMFFDCTVSVLSLFKGTPARGMPEAQLELTFPSAQALGACRRTANTLNPTSSSELGPHSSSTHGPLQQKTPGTPAEPTRPLPPFPASDQRTPGCAAPFLPRFMIALVTRCTCCFIDLSCCLEQRFLVALHVPPPISSLSMDCGLCPPCSLLPCVLQTVDHSCGLRKQFLSPATSTLGHHVRGPVHVPV